MDLTPAQQERYARHLILDDLGGEGQERLLAAAVRVQGRGEAALWAARYLAASGVGELAVEVEGWRDELQALGPWLRLGGPGVHLDHLAPRTLSPEDGASPSQSAFHGARAAAEAVRAIARGEP